MNSKSLEIKKYFSLVEAFKINENKSTFRIIRFYLILMIVWQGSQIFRLYYSTSTIQYITTLYLYVDSSKIWQLVLQYYSANNELPPFSLRDIIKNLLVTFNVILFIIFVIVFSLQFLKFDFQYDAEGIMKSIARENLFNALYDYFVLEKSTAIALKSFANTVTIISFFAFLTPLYFLEEYYITIFITTFPWFSSLLIRNLKLYLTLNAFLFLAFTIATVYHDGRFDSEGKIIYLFPLLVVYLAVFFASFFQIWRKKVSDFDLLLKYDKVASRLSSVQTQNENIINNINEGIVLLNNKYEFLQPFSSNFKSIFETSEDISKKSFFEYLKDKKVIDDNLENYANRFLKLLVGAESKSKETLIIKSNPLEKVEANLEKQEDKQIVKKWLYFKFSIVHLEQNKKEILVQIADRTREEELKLRIKKAKETQDAEIKIIYEITKSDPKKLSDFMYEVKDTIRNIRSLLENSVDHRKTFLNIYQKLHALKGKANILKMNSISEKIHEVEEHLNTILRKGEDISINDTIGNALLINQFQAFFNNVMDSAKKIGYIGKESEVGGSIVKELSNLIEDAIEVAKPEYIDKVIINHKINEKILDSLSKEKRSVLNDIVVQLTINSLKHGFPKSRITDNPTKKPQIDLSFDTDESDENKVVFIYKDNGVGVDIERVKMFLIKKGLIEKEEVEILSENKLLEYICEPGFSTSSDKDLHSGQGIGMGMIKAKITNDLNGDISLKQSKNEYFELAAEFKYN